MEREIGGVGHVGVDTSAELGACSRIRVAASRSESRRVRGTDARRGTDVESDDGEHDEQHRRSQSRGFRDQALEDGRAAGRHEDEERHEQEAQEPRDDVRPRDPEDEHRRYDAGAEDRAPATRRRNRGLEPTRIANAAAATNVAREGSTSVSSSD